LNAAVAAALLAAGVLLPGYAVLCLIAPGRRLPAAHFAGLVLALGAGTTSTALFLLSLAGLRPGSAAVGGICAAALLALGALAWRGELARGEAPSPPPRPHEWALAALPVLACAWLLADALRVPLHNIDAVAIWGLKAKLLAHETLRASPYFHDPTQSYSHQDYPLLVPLLMAAAYGLRGAFDEPLGKLVHVGIFVALLLLLHAGVRRSLSRTASLLLLVLFALSPPLLGQAAAGLADPALMLFYTGSLIALLAWLETGAASDLRIGCVLTAFLVFTKNEGMALAALNLAVFALATLCSRGERSVRALGGHAALALLPMLPWLAFRAGLPKTHENYGALLHPARVLDQLDRLPEIVGGLGRTLADLRLWGGLWWLLPLAWLLAGRERRSRAAAVLAACLAAHLATYVLIFVVTPWDVRVLLEAKAYALLLQASPALVLLLSVYWAKLWPPASAAGTR
jgi:hypothetical protein